MFRIICAIKSFYCTNKMFITQSTVSMGEKVKILQYHECDNVLIPLFVLSDIVRIFSLQENAYQ